MKKDMIRRKMWYAKTTDVENRCRSASLSPECAPATGLTIHGVPVKGRGGVTPEEESTDQPKVLEHHYHPPDAVLSQSENRDRSLTDGGSKNNEIGFEHRIALTEGIVVIMATHHRAY